MKIRYEAAQKAVVFRDDAGVPVWRIDTPEDAGEFVGIPKKAIESEQDAEINGVFLTTDDLKKAKRQAMRFIRSI